MFLPHGARLGPYEIVAALGAGGMGEVYKARDTRLDRSVAVKILPAAAADDGQRRERFRREARAGEVIAATVVAGVDGIDVSVQKPLFAFHGGGEDYTLRRERGWPAVPRELGRERHFAADRRRLELGCGAAMISA
ncbi:MAG TPA: hypothetical protein VKE96_14295 [Vicinamibacterales bacterium]|nr:hypothetical protein [Vicinamibacterales bacterium]